MAKKFFVSDHEGRKYWSTMKRGPAQPDQHQLAIVLQHDLTHLVRNPPLECVCFQQKWSQNVSGRPEKGIDHCEGVVDRHRGFQSYASLGSKL